MKSKLVMLALAAAMVVPPLSAAGWAGKGAAEPDTAQDVSGGWMFTNPDWSASAVRKVYFNGIMGQEFGYLPSVGSSVNPNVATLGTAHPTYPYRARAILGVWKDCNKDSYMGAGDNALFEYRSELLLDAVLGASICPPTAIPATRPAGWFPPHNDGEWVREFISIGYDNRANAQLPDANIFNVNDRGSRVWADDDLPGSPPSGTCYTTAHPRGTYQSVGGVVNLLDCYARGRVDATGSALGPAWTTIKGTNNPWGAENGGSMVTVWDCASAPVTSQSVANVDVAVRSPQVPTVSTSGSLAGTANATGSGLTPGCTPNYQSNRTNPGQSIAHAPYSTETDQVNNEVFTKIQPEFTLYYTEGSRPGGALGRGQPDDAGLGQPVYSRGFWGETSVRAASRNPYVDRNNVAIAPVTIETFYAYVSPTAVAEFQLTLPKGSAVGVYGFEACGSSIGTSVVKNGWACSRAAWYPAGPDSIPRDLSLGTDPTDPTKAHPVGRFVGDPYNMRDIDCYDESVKALRDLEIGYGVLSNTACPHP